MKRKRVCVYTFFGELCLSGGTFFGFSFFHFFFNRMGVKVQECFFFLFYIDIEFEYSFHYSQQYKYTLKVKS